VGGQCSSVRMDRCNERTKGGHTRKGWQKACNLDRWHHEGGEKERGYLQQNEVYCNSKDSHSSGTWGGGGGRRGAGRRPPPGPGEGADDVGAREEEERPTELLEGRLTARCVP